MRAMRGSLARHNGAAARYILGPAGIVLRVTFTAQDPLSGIAAPPGQTA
jgi:hypothetical protein